MKLWYGNRKIVFKNMDINNYILPSECEKLLKDLGSVDNSVLEMESGFAVDKEMNNEKSYITPSEVVRAVKSIINDEMKLKPPDNKSVVLTASSPTESNTVESGSKEIMHFPTDNFNKASGEPCQRGRVSLVRLQAVHPASLQQEVENTELSVVVPEPPSEKSSNQDATQVPFIPENYSWKTTESDLSSAPKTDSFEPQRSASSEGKPVLQILASASGVDKISNTLDIDKFLTADGHYVYGYKDSSGEVQFFCPAPNDRENHNEKERQRRSRVSEACSKLRKLVPGLTPKTDKATVFEQSVRYLKYLREKYGTQFDQMYCEKYFKREK